MAKVLLCEPHSAAHIVVTGATGYLGALTVASLLRDSTATLSCLVRATHDEASLLGPIAEEWEARGGVWTEQLTSRIRRIVLPADLAETVSLAERLSGADEIVHCAGYLDYYNIPLLEQINIGYTGYLLELGRKLNVKRFVYVSTAYSSGYQPNVTPEGSLSDPPADPTHYTRTKRAAEGLVAESRIPYLIVRPSILIGTSKTGRYSGKRYGLYQQWMGLERLTCDRYHAVFHTVAPKLPLNLLHQDSYGEMFTAAYLWVPSDSHVNLVSREDTSPSMRNLWDMWFETTRPTVIHYYDHMDDVPLAAIPARQRAYLTFAQVNLEIASHRWTFETTWLELLREQRGLSYVDASIESVRVCQERFVSVSAKITRYLERHRKDMPVATEIIEGSARAAYQDELHVS
jgi:nucleoside-diphosphate-sugar epimerase